MTPYYEGGGVTIWHGDCRDVTVEAEAVVTDPPYGTHLYATDKTVLTGEMLAEWCSSHKAVMVFGYAERLVKLCADAGVVPTEWVTWWPSNARCRGFNMHGLWRESEHVAAFGKGEWTALRQRRTASSRAVSASMLRYPTGYIERPSDVADDTRMGDVWTDSSPGQGFQHHLRHHPNEKPVRVMSRLVQAAGGTILDPFMGSGSTLIAARSLGVTATGVEIDEAFCEIAAKRLAQGVLDFGAPDPHADEQDRQDALDADDDRRAQIVGEGAGSDGGIGSGRESLSGRSPTAYLTSDPPPHPDPHADEMDVVDARTDELDRRIDSEPMLRSRDDGALVDGDGRLL